MVEQSVWATIVINLLSAIPPTLAAIAAILVARKASPETKQKLDEIDTHVTDVRTAVINHVTDKSVHRGRRN